MSARLIVGVAGGSGSGKTTLTRRLLERLPGGMAVHISHDAYYRDLAHLELEERARWNFDHPDSLESELLIRHLELLRAGERVEIPTYDFSTHTRASKSLPVRPAPVVIVEGVLVLAVKELRNRLDLGVFVDTAASERLTRRVRRDTRQRGRSRESVLEQWRETVDPMYEQFVVPSRAHAHHVVHHGGFDRKAVSTLAAEIMSRVGPV
jgi:uridine kinase